MRRGGAGWKGIDGSRLGLFARSVDIGDGLSVQGVEGGYVRWSV